ncbi:MAG: VOC family protein [Myxococcales bacterium]|nr:VOC family protein [Myxococcales bacterium]
MSIQSNHFCWQGISTDMAKAKAFYTNVLGWDVITDEHDTQVFIGKGGAVGHLQAPENGPPSWCSFLSVDDLDASTALAAEHGGTVIVPPTDLPAGRFSVVTTPSGAAFGLYQAVEQDTLAEPGPGSIHWVELQTTALDQDLAWLTSVFGFTTRVQEFASGPYHVLEAGGTSRGGVASTPAERSAFVAWVQVDDLDATLAKVGKHGGSTIGATVGEPSVGQMAMVSDPSGATFGLIQPA